jgi:phosphoketolase
MDMIFVVGPGHGAPAILASLWLEGSLGKFYPEYSRDKAGLHQLISRFAVTGGFPRYLSPLDILGILKLIRSATSMLKLLERSMKVESWATHSA